ncbi:MAG: glycine--tRNA ligase subunit beta [Candidatus Omnitrophica bacterium]|nr:glycine--tRNA ligase subunit beta [Candidatus Omnitrophota bacterium]
MPTTSLLIEIGTEELPMASLDLVYAVGVENIRKPLSKNRLGHKEIYVEATPRRLAFFVEDLASAQAEEKTTILGPAQDKAYEGEGKPTPALTGFLHSKKASLRDVKIQETPRGRYVAFEKITKGEATVKILPRLITEILSSFFFPKTMRWEKSAFRFPRPIRWVVALYGKKILSFPLAGIKAGRVSYGHRFLGARPLPIQKADWKEYQRKLKSQHVILSLKERENLIQKRLQKKFHQKDFDSDLVHETAQLVEEPFLVQGKFSGTYRDLPEEVLATCMKKYQKIFACHDERGHLANRFVAVLNGRRSDLSRIQQDYENVLGSRLRDAQYFYEEDSKEPLERKVARLRELVFLGRLGTMEEKVVRLRGLASDLSHLSGHQELQKSLDRVAYLSKADLVTHMVGEFPELQGIMGREYAHASGESGEVARAIGEQYLPKNLGEDYKTLSKKLSLLGALFGIVDRLDLLVGAFGMGLDPTGSEDPYALRRAGGILIKLVRSFSLRFSISKLIQESHSEFKVRLDASVEEVIKKFTDFLRDRVAFELQVKSGTRSYEILQSVMKSSFDDLADVFERFGALHELSSKQPNVFFKTSKVVERTSNILKGVKEALHSVDPKLFQDELEKELFGLLQKKEPELKAALEKKDYDGLTRLYGETFYDPLHQFFERVMVNVEDAPIRRNRQALMKEINTLYTDGVADLSLLSQVRE